MGFGAPPPARPRSKTEELTDTIEDMVLEHGSELTAMALDALKTGMRNKDAKLRLDAAKAYLHNFHNPAKRIDMDVQEQVTISAGARDAVDQLTDEERAIMARFEQKLLEMRPEIHEAEDVEEIDEDEEHVDPSDVVVEEPANGSGWSAPDLPPLPPEGREV